MSLFHCQTSVCVYTCVHPWKRPLKCCPLSPLSSRSNYFKKTSIWTQVNVFSPHEFPLWLTTNVSVCGCIWGREIWCSPITAWLNIILLIFPKHFVFSSQQLISNNTKLPFSFHITFQGTLFIITNLIQYLAQFHYFVALNGGPITQRFTLASEGLIWWGSYSSLSTPGLPSAVNAIGLRPHDPVSSPLLLICLHLAALAVEIGVGPRPLLCHPLFPRARSLPGEPSGRDFTRGVMKLFVGILSGLFTFLLFALPCDIGLFANSVWFLPHLSNEPLIILFLFITVTSVLLSEQCFMCLFFIYSFKILNVKYLKENNLKAVCYPEEVSCCILSNILNTM